MTEVKDIVPPADKAAADAKAKADADASGGKVGDIFNGDNKSKEPKTVPEAALLEFKNENKTLWKEIEKLQGLITEGVTKKEVNEKLKAIGDKYKVDPQFLAEVADAIKSEPAAFKEPKAPKEAKEPDEEPKESSTAKSARIDAIFKENFDKTIAAMPDFKDIADADVIKSLTLDPSNRDKTFRQIIEKAYGHLVKSKGKTIDTANPGGSKEPAAIDYDKAARDPEYFKSILADPALKKEYNANLHRRLKL